jgi:ubiquinone/menaquinone biosynthesis C-methylase UbiE
MNQQLHEQLASYIGKELDVFSHAVNWKRYWKSKIRPFMGKTVLEVGAGIGGTTVVACDETFDYWLGLEPDVEMASNLQKQKSSGQFCSVCEFQAGTILDLLPNQLFDSIIYIDVLEHIEHDRAELENAAKHLKSGGHLIVLSPAYQFLYSPFDKAIGHYRRYTRKTLISLTPTNTKIANAFYLDSLALLLSMGNKYVLESSQPTLHQIQLWDSMIIPVSRYADWLFGYNFGRSIISIWQRA